MRVTTNYEICFDTMLSSVSILGYVDSNYAINMDDRKFTTYHVFTVANSLISSRSTLQSVITLSTT